MFAQYHEIEKWSMGAGATCHLSITHKALFGLSAKFVCSSVFSSLKYQCAHKLYIHSKQALNDIFMSSSP